MSNEPNVGWLGDGVDRWITVMTTRANKRNSKYSSYLSNRASLLVKIKGGVNERFWELNYSLLKVLFEVPENNQDSWPKVCLFLQNNMIKVMATIQFLRRRSCGGFCPQTGRSTSRCYVAWTAEAPKGIYDHCGPFGNFFILNFVWRPFFALLNCFLRLLNSFPFKTLFTPHSCQFRGATWPLPGEHQRAPTWKKCFFIVQIITLRPSILEGW